MKRILSLLCVACLLMTLFSVIPVSAALTDDGFVYEIIEEKVTIVDYTGDNTEVIIPAGIEGYPVTSIGYQAFAGCDITHIIIPDSVEIIDDFAFNGCTSLECVTIPNSVTSIGWSAFSNCYSLVSVDIPNSVEFIGCTAFIRCNSLKAINVDSANINYTSVDGVLFNKSITKIIQYPKGKSITSYNLPNSVTDIADYAFSDCSGLVSITIPDNVMSIGNSAFYNCSALTSIIIPDNVIIIGNNAFNYCSFLKTVTITGNVKSIGFYAFIHCDNLTDVYYSGTEEQWSQIAISEYNDSLLNANVHFNSAEAGVVLPTNPLPDPPSTDTNAYEKGDANKDGQVNILDATTIQKHLAQLITLGESNLIFADANGDRSVNILDATHIQKLLAQLIPNL